MNKTSSRPVQKFFLASLFLQLCLAFIYCQEGVLVRLRNLRQWCRLAARS
jgi:hypothetical protein